MSNLSGQGGELRATVHITRKATGKVETYELVGRTTPEQHEQIMPKHHGTSGALTGPGSICTTQEN
jgi:hypothetical protein